MKRVQSESHWVELIYVESVQFCLLQEIFGFLYQLRMGLGIKLISKKGGIKMQVYQNKEAPLERILIQIVSAISCVWNIFCRKFLFQKVQTVKNPVLMHFCCILDVVFSQRIHREQRCILPFITVCPLQNLCFIDPVICIDFAAIPIWDKKKREPNKLPK